MYESKTDESILDTLLRHNIDIPYACKAGVCNTCVMVADGGKPSCNATLGLKETLVEQGYFLSCQCVPSAPISVRKADEFGLFSQALVIQKSHLSKDVCRLRLRTSTDLYYRAGQYINIRGLNEQIRSYSLASVPTQDDYLELHIKRMPNGLVSDWLFNDVSLEDTLDIQGAYGDCYYLPNNPDKDILMIGTGTGLAPLIGILRDAIASGHQGQIRLYHGDKEPDGLYLDDDLRTFADMHDNVHYIPCVSVSTGDVGEDIFKGRAADRAFTDNKDLKGQSVYLCGSPEMVKSARKIAYLSGASMKDIYADPFITKDLRQAGEQQDNKLSESKERRQ
jgi:NAD(P)H-flavin reductase/ferredoxin